MTCESKIRELIDLLDDNRDALLINLLEQTISNKYQEYLEKHSISDMEFIRSKNGVRRFIKNVFFDSHKSYNKCESILENNNCDHCERKILKKTSYNYFRDNEFIEYFSMDENNPICVSCNNRHSLLSNHSIALEEIISCDIENFLSRPDVEEIIKCKAIITKLNKLLTNIRRTKNETS